MFVLSIDQPSGTSWWCDIDMETPLHQLAQILASSFKHARAMYNTYHSQTWGCDKLRSKMRGGSSPHEQGFVYFVYSTQYKRPMAHLSKGPPPLDSALAVAACWPHISSAQPAHLGPVGYGSIRYIRHTKNSHQHMKTPVKPVVPPGRWWFDKSVES